MFKPDQYQLIDFGSGRKLERFGNIVLDRPSPAAESSEKFAAQQWSVATAAYNRGHGSDGIWKPKSFAIQPWNLSHGAVTFALQPTPFGHVGVFPEQAPNWDWIAKQVARGKRSENDKVIRVLNLFGYTGGSTLAAAAAGAEVTHVDSSKSVVAWARQNAELSGLADACIRWIVEDARKYVARELKREASYDAIILDPPSYGHGVKGEAWKIERDLPNLLTACAQLTDRKPLFVLLSCHSSGFGPAELEAILADTFFGSCQAGARCKPMQLQTAGGRTLNAGYAARWPA